MAARNLLSGEVLIRRADAPSDPLISVDLSKPNNSKHYSLAYTDGTAKQPVRRRIQTESSRFWVVVRGSDDDIHLLRSYGYALVDGRDA